MSPDADNKRRWPGILGSQHLILKLVDTQQQETKPFDPLHHCMLVGFGSRKPAPNLIGPGGLNSPTVGAQHKIKVQIQPWDEQSICSLIDQTVAPFRQTLPPVPNKLMCGRLGPNWKRNHGGQRLSRMRAASLTCAIVRCIWLRSTLAASRPVTACCHLVTRSWVARVLHCAQ